MASNISTSSFPLASRRPFLGSLGMAPGPVSGYPSDMPFSCQDLSALSECQEIGFPLEKGWTSGDRRMKASE